MVLQESTFPERPGYAVGSEKGSRQANSAGHAVAQSGRSAFGHGEKYCYREQVAAGLAETREVRMEW